MRIQSVEFYSFITSTDRTSISQLTTRWYQFLYAQEPTDFSHSSSGELVESNELGSCLEYRIEIHPRDCDNLYTAVEAKNHTDKYFLSYLLHGAESFLRS